MAFPLANCSTPCSNNSSISGRRRTTGLQPLVLCNPELWSAGRLCARFGAALAPSCAWAFTNQACRYWIGRDRSRKSLPGMQQLVAGDLLAGALLCVRLQSSFGPISSATFWHLANSSVFTNGCTVSWPLGAVRAARADQSRSTHAHIHRHHSCPDRFTNRAVVLALAGAVSGLAALGGVGANQNESRPLPSAIQRTIEHAGYLRACLADTAGHPACRPKPWRWRRTTGHRSGSRF